MPLSVVQFMERAGSNLIRERVLRATYDQSGDATSALIRSSTLLRSPLPVAGGAIPLRTSTHASDAPSPRVARALETFRIAAEQAEAGSIIVDRGSPTIVRWAPSERAEFRSAPLDDAPMAVRDAVAAARAARSRITGGPLRPMDPTFT